MPIIKRGADKIVKSATRCGGDMQREECHNEIFHFEVLLYLQSLLSSNLKPSTVYQF
jgi:hypothetical protein